MKRIFTTIILVLAASLHAQKVNVKEQVFEEGVTEKTIVEETITQEEIVVEETVKEPVKEKVVLTKPVQDSWTLAIGVNYREMGELNMDAFQAADGGFLDGAVTDFGGGLWLFEVEDPMQQVDGTELDKVTFTSAETFGGTDRIDNGIGFIIRAEKGSGINGWSTYEVLSLVTAWVDSEANAAASGTYYEYDVGQNWNTLPDIDSEVPFNPPPGSPIPEKDTAVGANNSFVVVPNGNAKVNFSYDVELGYYTFGAGLASTYNDEAFRFYVGAGPSLSLVDYDIERSVTGYWSDGSGAFYREGEDASSTKVRAGIYAEVGMEYHFNERWGMGVSGRYDWIPVDINTDLGSIELSGLSGQISLIYNF